MTKTYKISIVTGLMFFLYVISYLFLSSLGEYKVYYKNIDQGIFEEWHPLYASYTSSNTAELKSNLLGYFYSPQIIVDRKYVHQNQAIKF